MELARSIRLLRLAAAAGRKLLRVAPLVLAVWPFAGIAPSVLADDVELEIPMAIPRLDRLDALVPLPATEPAPVHLELRFDEKGKIVNGGECLVDGAAVVVTGKVTTKKGVRFYSLKLKGLVTKIKGSILGELKGGAGFATVQLTTPRGKTKVLGQAVTLTTTSITSAVTLVPTLDVKGRLVGTAVLTAGFVVGPPVIGTLKGKISKSNVLSFTAKIVKQSLSFKGNAVGEGGFTGTLKYTLPPEKGVALGYTVGLGLYCPLDRDCDGLSDTDELAGWEVTVILANGTERAFSSTSDPGHADTDGDGLHDGQERASGTDPRRGDTDDDGIGDRSELAVYKSNPVMVDSDEDSRGPAGTASSDPNLWDGNELTLTKTSPTLADTDGDGFTDWEEIHAGGTSPRVADLPELELRLYTDPDIVLNVVASTTEQYVMSSLEQETSEYQRTDTESTRMAIENTIQLHTEVEAGTSNWPPSASAKLTTDTKFEHSYVNETSSSWTQGSVNETKNTYNEVKDRISQLQNGIIKVGMRIANNSNVAIRLSDPRVIATRFTPGGSFRSVGTLGPGDMVYDPATKQQSWVPDPQVWEMEMGPGEEVVLEIGDGAVPAQTMEALLRDPTALMFEIGSYALKSADGSRDYVQVGQDVIARTGVIVIDFGDGVVERRAVATNVYRKPDGSGAGVTLREALQDILDVDYGTCAEETWPEWPNCDTREPTGDTILCRIRNRSAYGDCGDFHRGFWIVGGNGADFDRDPADFDDIVIHNGERVSLVWVQDTDGDGLFDREEYLLGTDLERADSDGDLLDDYTESRIGWMVAVAETEPYECYPDPRFVDIDEDSLADGYERFIGTDPYLKDTDGDGDADSLDPDPLQPPCLEGGEMLLAGWWDGSIAVAGETLLARDIWATDGQASNGTCSNAAIGIPQGADRVYRFVNLQSSQDYISVPDHVSIGPTQQYTIAAWINWGGVGGGQGWALVLGKGLPEVANYAVYVSSDGKLRQSMRRTYHTKCVQCSIFGCNDSLCADDSGVDTQAHETGPGAIPPNTWVHVAATYSDQVMALYVNGEKVHEASTRHYWESGLNRRTRTTTGLVSNTAPLMIGGDPNLPAPYGPYRGLVDDVQVFHRGLNAGQVKLLHRFGTCEP